MDSHGRNIEYTDAVTAQYAAFCAAHREMGEHRPFAYDHHRVDRLAARIAEALDGREPFSLIRLGDGEGVCLLTDADGPEMRRAAMARTLALHFGPADDLDADADFWLASMTRALAQASIVCAPHPAACRGAAERQSDDIRGTVGLISSGRAGQTGDIGKAVLYARAHAHVHLLPHYKALLSGREVVLVTCYGRTFADRFRTSFGCTLAGHVEIPPQRLNVGGPLAEPLYPTQVERVRAEVRDLAAPGRVAVVAAGLIAKELCGLFAQGGGAALDVGSVVDVWEGTSVRKYHTDGFVADHVLPAAFGHRRAPQRSALKQGPQALAAAHASALEYTPQVLTEYEAFCERYAAMAVARPFALGEPSVATLAERVRAAADDGRPFALVRLTDGEGACLVEDADGPALRRAVMARTLKLHFGLVGCEADDLAYWRESIINALSAATIVCAPHPDGARKAAATKGPDIRATAGAIAAARAAQEGAIGDAQLYRSFHAHVHLLPHYADLLRGRDVVLVTCYGAAFADRFEAGFAARVVSRIDIPKQSANLKGPPAEPLYPRHVERVHDELAAAAAPGRIAVIGAGLFGRELSASFAKRGGVALDVGTVMDLWQGARVRPYHSETLLNAYALPESDQAS